MNLINVFTLYEVKCTVGRFLWMLLLLTDVGDRQCSSGCESLVSVSCWLDVYYVFYRCNWCWTAVLLFMHFVSFYILD